MAKPIPKWIMSRYAILWNRFKGNEFSHDQAYKTLKDDKAIISLFLSELRKSGWLGVEIDPEDTRKRLYKLVNPNDAIKTMIKEKS